MADEGSIPSESTKNKGVGNENFEEIGTSSKGRIAHFDCVHDCSNQSVPANFQRGLAQSGSAPALGAGGRVFESLNPDHFKNSGES